MSNLEKLGEAWQLLDQFAKDTAVPNVGKIVEARKLVAQVRDDLASQHDKLYPRDWRTRGEE